jgi:YYY domain-containing protein
MEISGVLIWYLTVTFLGVLVLPLAFHFFQHLPDRGISFVKPLGLLAVGFVYWFLGSLNILTNDNGGLILAILIVVCFEIVIVKKKELLELKAWLSNQRRILLATELLFFLVFLGWVIIRAYNPNIEGTEKPMEYMFINSILKSPSFPLRDAWLSDYAISYYYFGYLIIALLTRITGTLPPLAFNLGLALLFALSAAMATGLVMNLIAVAKNEKATKDTKAKSSLISSFWPALLGPLIVLLVGNFYGALEFVHDNALPTDIKVPTIYYDFGYSPDLSQVHSLLDMERKPGIQVGSVNIWEWLDLKQLGPQITANPSNNLQWDLPNWFFSARVVHDKNLIGQETEAIDEVPAFSFLLGDMHPHVLALPFGILAAAMAFEWLLVGRRKAVLFLENPKENRLLPNWDKFALSVTVLGGLIVLNTWDFPIYWFLTVACWTVGIGSAVGIKRLFRLWVTIAKYALILLGGSLVLYFPFFITFQSQAGGILPNLIYPTRFQQIFVMFGPVFIMVSLFLIWFTRSARRIFSLRIMFWTALGLLVVLIFATVLLSSAGFFSPATLDIVTQSIYPLTLNEAFSLLLQRRLVDSLTAVIGVMIIGMVISIFAGIFRSSLDPKNQLDENATNKEDHIGISSIWLCLVMVLVGALLLVGPDFVYLRDNFGTRMNTMFKFYFQVWILWGLAGSFGIWYIFSHIRTWIRVTFTVGMSIILLLGLYYLFGGLISKTGNFVGPPSLDGMAYFAQSYPNDWAAIQWLNEKAKNDSIILEGSRGAYWVEGRSSRFSMATGLQTLMGWDNHEAQWRGNYFVNVSGRQEDIKTIYQIKDWKTTEDLLNKYQVRYVIVSSLELNWYRPVYTAKFDQHMSQVFKSGDVIIYESTFSHYRN